MKGLKDYVKIFQEKSTRPILTRLNLKAMEARMPESLFARVHNSYIVNISKITSTQKSQLALQGVSIPIGAAFAEIFFLKYRRE